ncbi:MAG: hypothetical protein SFY81_02135 [Verrucomicrobiota bacterium]|nr:hypothetical protein [Verrucomicrobiota bacterium]
MRISGGDASMLAMVARNPDAFKEFKPPMESEALKIFNELIKPGSSHDETVRSVAEALKKWAERDTQQYLQKREMVFNTPSSVTAHR